jgi:hypothetical protein
LYVTPAERGDCDWNILQALIPLSGGDDNGLNSVFSFGDRSTRHAWLTARGGGLRPRRERGH